MQSDRQCRVTARVRYPAFVHERADQTRVRQVSETRFRKMTLRLLSTGEPGTLAIYWRFYWPLALTGAAMVLAGQFQNGILARYPEAVTELAIFALAGGLFGLFHAAVNFVSQMSNVYARSRHGLVTCLTFVLLASGVLSIGMAALAFTRVGPWFIGVVYDVDVVVIARIVDYLQLFIPLMLIDGIRQFLVGLLVQNRLTGQVTILNLVQMGTMIAALLAGFSLDLSAPHVLVGAQILSACTHLAGLLYVVNRNYRMPGEPEHESVGLRELFGFFLPVATTGIMFAISRPVLYALIARTPDAIISIAALRVGFDLASLFQMTANQFRHFFVTFGAGELPSKRLFMLLIGAGIIGVMLLVVATPVSRFLLADLIGIEGRVLAFAREVLLLMSLLPALILWRNYYHGLLMVARKTSGMALGGIIRVVGIYVVGQALLLVEALDHRTATLILLMGFLLEAVVVTLVYRGIARSIISSRLV
jgi:hypothetical protein